MFETTYNIRLLVLNGYFALFQMYSSAWWVYLFMCKLSIFIFASGVKFHLLTLIFVFLPLLCHFLWYKKMVVKARDGDWVALNKLTGTLASSGRQRGVGVGGQSRASPGADAPCSRILAAPGEPVSRHGGQRKWLPKTAGGLPDVCREPGAHWVRGASPAGRIIWRCGRLKLGATFGFLVFAKCCVVGRDSRRAAVRSCAQKSAAVCRNAHLTVTLTWKL